MVLKSFGEFSPYCLQFSQSEFVIEECNCHFGITIFKCISEVSSGCIFPPSTVSVRMGIKLDRSTFTSSNWIYECKNTQYRYSGYKEYLKEQWEKEYANIIVLRGKGGKG